MKYGSPCAIKWPSGIKACPSHSPGSLFPHPLLSNAQPRRVLRQAKALYPDLIVIVVTGYGDIRNAVNMMKLGAADYIQKPFLKEELILRIEKAIEQRQWRWQSRAAKEETNG